MIKRTIAMLMVLALMLPASYGSYGQDYGEKNDKKEITDLTISDRYVVNDGEIWANITVLKGGSLYITSTGFLIAENIFVDGGNIKIDGGKIDIKSDKPSADVFFKGVVNNFTLRSGAKVSLTGSSGILDINHSYGGDAIFDLNITGELIINNTVIEIKGGAGKTNNNAWTTSDLTGRFASGGNSSFHLTVVSRDSSIKNLRIMMIGGSGGSAADGKSGTQAGAGGEGGGYTNGGNVSGYVGAGGRCSMRIAGENMTIDGLLLFVNGGKGGNAGDGADSLSTTGAGGGGGGYTGGNGGDISSPYDSASPGGNVIGHVGSGGDVIVSLECQNLTLLNSSFMMFGGKGGDAGNGGDGYFGGGGGGGYGGGGGGASDWMGGDSTGGNGGNVIGDIGKGGDVYLGIQCKNLQMHHLDIYCAGGGGGKAGDGGNSNAWAGGGGGGYGGGGGLGEIWRGTSNAGSTYVDGWVGAGGNATIEISAGRTYIADCKMDAFGGKAGYAGDGGNGYYSGGGGGGYGGGGGGGDAGDTVVLGHCGKGGNGIIRLQSSSGPGEFIAYTSSFNVFGGKGGDAGKGGTEGGGWGVGSGGGGGFGGGGGGGYRGSGGSCAVNGSIGDGGNATFIVEHVAPSISDTCNYSLNPGKKGYGMTAKGGGTTGGAGIGRDTNDGCSTVKMSMGVPILLTPEDGHLFNNELSSFTWNGIIAHPEEGPVSEYYLEIDDDINFTSPEVSFSEVPDINSFTPTTEVHTGGQYYWRMKAVYLSSNSYGWTPCRVFYFNTPPIIKENIRVQFMNEDETAYHLIDLNDYFTDPLFPEQLEYEIADETDPTKVLAVIDSHYITFKTPTKDWYGQQRFKVRAIDPYGLWTESNPFTVRVRPVNDPPVIKELPKVRVLEDTEYIFDLTAYVSDVDSPIDSLVVNTSSPFVNPEGLSLRIRYPGDIEHDIVNITISDGKNKTDASMEIIVEKVNDAPVTEKIKDIVIDEDKKTKIPLTAYGIDEEDGRDLRWSISYIESVPEDLLTAYIDEQSMLHIVPTKDSYGSGKIYLVAMDSGGKTATGYVNVKVRGVNDAPYIKKIPTQKAMIGSYITINLTEYIGDIDNTLSQLSIVTSDHEHTSVDNYTLIVTLPENAFSDMNNTTIKITVSDGDLTTTGELKIIILHPPTISQQMQNVIVEVGKETKIDLNKYVRDKEDPLEFLTWEVHGVNTKIAEVYIDPSTHELIVKGKKVGTTEVKLVVFDRDGGTASQTVHIKVTETSEKGEVPTALYSGAAFIIIAVGIAIMLYFMSGGKKGRRIKEVESIEKESDDNL